LNNLHRELAPISDAAWTDLEDEARRTFQRHAAGRRVVDVPRDGRDRAVRRRHGSPRPDCRSSRRDRRVHTSVQPIVELRLPFTGGIVWAPAVDEAALRGDAVDAAGVN
jgi:uncharacterized linocin/CFP29 family protein